MSHRFNPLHSFIRLFLIVVLPVLAGVAQETASSGPLTADEVIARLVAMNQLRAQALSSYSSLRTYHLECHCIAPKKADMVVRVKYNSPRTKDFDIVSETGSGTVRSKVFRKLLEAEQESLQEDNERRSAITPENYTFRLLSYEKGRKGDAYVLEVEPRGKSKFLFRGRVWVDATDFAITRVEGEPAVNPSWWTKSTDFTRTYEKVGDFWLPQSNDSVTKVRVFGTAVLKISYGEYQVTQAPELRVMLSEVKLPTGQ